jgi:hypothetical protein
MAVLATHARLFFRSFDQQEHSTKVFSDVITACSHVIQAAAGGSGTTAAGAGAGAGTGAAAEGGAGAAAATSTPTTPGPASGATEGKAAGGGSSSGTGTGAAATSALGTWANVTVRQPMCVLAYMSPCSGPRTHRCVRVGGRSMDQLDKTDPPTIPDGYIGTVALACLVLSVDGIAGDVMPIYLAAEVSATEQRGGALVSPGRPGVPPRVDVRGRHTHLAHVCVYARVRVRMRACIFANAPLCCMCVSAWRCGALMSGGVGAPGGAPPQACGD